MGPMTSPLLDLNQSVPGFVAGAGSNDTRHAIHLTERVIAAGAEAVLSVTPYYNGAFLAQAVKKG